MDRRSEIGRGERMIRIFEHLVRHRTRRFGIADVQQFLEAGGPVLRRNVERDLKALSEVCGDCIGSERDGGLLYYFVRPDMRQKFSLPIRRNGLLAFFLLKRLQRFFAPTARTFEEMEDAITDRSKEDDYDLFEDLDEGLEQSTYVFGEQSPLALDGTLMNELLTALVKRRKLKLKYLGNDYDKPREITVCPVKLVLSRGELYFLCCSEYRQDWNFFIKLCRIMEASLLDGTFTLPAERIAKIEKRLADSFGIWDANEPAPQKVVIDFPWSWRLILGERRYHRSQQVTVLPDKRLRLTMSVPVDLDLVQWVLGWSEAEVTVVEPKELKDRLAAVGRLLVERYTP